MNTPAKKTTTKKAAGRGSTPEFKIATSNFTVGLRRIRKGDAVEVADPVMKGREHLFAAPETLFRKR